MALLQSPCPEGRIPVGASLSPGDQALAGQVVSLERLDRFLSFDPGRGLLRVEAGLSLGEIEATLAPRGWVLASVPGHWGGSLGGALATGAAGMDHHRLGGFGHQAQGLLVATPAHGLVPCAREERAPLFHAQLGGFGLCGAIVEATLQLQAVETTYLAEDRRRAKDAGELVARLREAEARHAWVRAWVDPYARGPALGRGVVIAADAIQRAELPDGQAEALGFTPPPPPRFASLWRHAPAWALAQRQAAAWREAPEAERRTRPRGEVLGWRQGQAWAWRRDLVVHRAWLPWDHAPALLTQAIECLNGEAVLAWDLQALGTQSGPLEAHHPGLGWCFSVRPSEALWPKLQRLDGRLAELGGRCLPGGDLRLSPQALAGQGSALTRFQALAQRVDPEGSLSSQWARRLHVRGT